MKAPNTKQMVMACAACLLTLGLALPSGATAEEFIPFKSTGIKSEKMPKVFFTHDNHQAYLKDDCTPCHREDTPNEFLDVAAQPEGKRVKYMHETCTACHIKYNKGPRLTECRTCHSASIAAQQGAAAAK